MAEAEYYDIVVVGKTGQGRTTLGNKLLEGAANRFMPSDPDMVLMSNEETKVRVLDVPGFSELGTGQQTTEQRNEVIVRSMGTVQREFGLKIRRVVYFLPVRGPLGKADGAMQEELKILHHYFGKELFECMVVAATNSRKFQDVGFDDEDYDITKRVFHVALKSAIEEDIECPPIVYIGLNEDALNKIQGAPVLKDSTFPSSREDIEFLYPDPDLADYIEVKHHPSLEPRYTPTEKFVGGCAHLATGGVAMVYEYATGNETWPFFTNADERCKDCRQDSKTEGCVVMEEPVIVID